MDAGVGNQEGIRDEKFVANKSLFAKFKKDPWFNEPYTSSFLSSDDFIGNFYSGFCGMLQREIEDIKELEKFNANDLLLILHC